MIEVIIFVLISFLLLIFTVLAGIKQKYTEEIKEHYLEEN